MCSRSIRFEDTPKTSTVIVSGVTAHCSTIYDLTAGKMIMPSRPLLSCRPKCSSWTMKIAALIVCFLVSNNNIAGQRNRAAHAFQQPSRRTSCSTLPSQKSGCRQMSGNFVGIGSERKFATSTSNLRLRAEATSSSSSDTGTDTSAGAGSFDDFDYTAVSTCTSTHTCDMHYGTIPCSSWCFSLYMYHVTFPLPIATSALVSGSLCP